MQAELAAAEAIFDQELVSALDPVNEFCRYIRGYRGKMMRPGLLLLTAKATGRIQPAHPVLAAVVEMVHVSTLVHDDVLDSADERRGKPTVRSLSGNNAAVLLGDYLISHSFHLCSSLDDQRACRLIAGATNQVCEGELLQNLQRRNLELGEDEYFEIIRRKTGALTAVSCELGAYYAHAEAKATESMREFGMALGTAFQIVDDVLDLVGDERLMGKTLGLDAALGKPTLPIIHSLREGDRESKRRVREICAGRADQRDLADLLKRDGSIEYALSAARRHVMEATNRLNVLPPSDAREALRASADFVLDRQI